MTSAKIFASHKKEILGALVGALITATLSLAIGLYSMNRSFQMSQKKDLLFSLRTDITLLKKVESELDVNLNFLLNHNYRIVYEVETVPQPNLPVGMKEDKEVGEIMQQWLDYMSQLQGGRLCKISKIVLPPNNFAADAWPSGGPAISDINFDLLQKINDLYRIFARVNKFIKNMRAIHPGSVHSASVVNNLNTIIPQYNSVIGEITQNKIVQLKNEISKELDRLKKEYDQIRL